MFSALDAYNFIGSNWMSMPVLGSFAMMDAMMYVYIAPGSNWVGVGFTSNGLISCIISKCDGS